MPEYANTPFAVVVFAGACSSPLVTAEAKPAFVNE